MPSLADNPEDWIHAVIPVNRLPQIKKQMHEALDEVFELVTSSHAPHGGASIAFYNETMAEYYRRLVESGDAVSGLPKWVHDEAERAVTYRKVQRDHSA